MINDAMVYAYQAGYNIVFVQVRGRGYAYYNSNIVPKHPKINPDFDISWIVSGVADDL